VGPVNDLLKYYISLM